MGMIMHDDVPYGEGTSYTQGTGIAINNNVIAVDADNTPTAESEKPVKSKGVYEVVEQIYADNGVLGAKNLWVPNRATGSGSGLTWTSDEDGIITVTGQNTGQNSYYINILNRILLPKGTYIFSGCPANSLDISLFVRPWSQTQAIWGQDYGDSPKVMKLTEDTEVMGFIRVGGGVNVGTQVFKPMITLASDARSNYANFSPYAMTNRELTEAIDEFTSSVSPVNSVVTFPDLNPDYGYKLYVDIPDETSSLPTNLTDLPVCKWTKVQRSTKADGTITLAYTVTNINVNYCLRILK